MYDLLARYYDQIHASLTADLPFIRDLAEQIGGPLLELGSGTGRLLIPLAAAGFRITGVDSSPQMLAVARRRLAAAPPAIQRAVTLVTADIRTLSTDSVAAEFALALLSYNTLLHFPEPEIALLFKKLAALLRQDGLLLIDIENPFLIAATPFPSERVLERSFTDHQTGRKIEQWSRSSVDPGAQTLTVSWLFQNAERKAEQEEAEITYHFLYPHQIELLLRQGGFMLQSVLGGYDGEPFSQESERLLVLARLA